MEELVIRTQAEREVRDITREVQELAKGKEGVCHLLLLHTTAALTTADLDNGTDQDMLAAYDALAPELLYRHRHNPGHARWHVMASLIGQSLCVPVQKGELQLGAWQKIVVVEFGGPRERSIAVTIK